jgi:hypothetical protein
VSAAALVSLIAVLFGVLLIVIAIIIWQEAKRRPSYEPLEYVVEDAVKHVETGLASEGKDELKRRDIRLILEWEVFYLQGLAQKKRSNPVETVAGGHQASIEYIVEQIATKHGVTYSPSDVEDVLRYEADYLLKIGAIGEPVESLGGDDE